MGKEGPTGDAVAGGNGGFPNKGDLTLCSIDEGEMPEEEEDACLCETGS